MLLNGPLDCSYFLILYSRPDDVNWIQVHILYTGERRYLEAESEPNQDTHTPTHTLHATNNLWITVKDRFAATCSLRRGSYIIWDLVWLSMLALWFLIPKCKRELSVLSWHYSSSCWCKYFLGREEYDPLYRALQCSLVLFPCHPGIAVFHCSGVGEENPVGCWWWACLQCWIWST